MFYLYCLCLCCLWPCFSPSPYPDLVFCNALFTTWINIKYLLVCLFSVSPLRKCQLHQSRGFVLLLSAYKCLEYSQHLKILGEWMNGWMDEHYTLWWLFSNSLAAGAGTLHTTVLLCGITGSLREYASRGFRGSLQGWRGRGDTHFSLSVSALASISLAMFLHFSSSSSILEQHLILDCSFFNACTTILILTSQRYQHHLGCVVSSKIWVLGPWVPPPSMAVLVIVTSFLCPPAVEGGNYSLWLRSPWFLGIHFLSF